ncbi:hypothetical protein [Nocardia sp. NPDC057030]|uniref:hypothetical protein n=1 Tax=unclassified Nocardia TaxID=2637762 RepID=UPI00363D6278
MTISAGDIYRRTDEYGQTFEVTAVRPVPSFGTWQVGTRQIPCPVLGPVWIGEVRDPFLGTAMTLCTPQGLTEAGFALAVRVEAR